MNHLANVWVFSDNAERYAELMTGARQWEKKFTPSCKETRRSTT
ncbi:electron transfer flavoprotein subunit alpha [Salmonella enterica subsp. enterica serovar Sanjuan]|uniref:Electron transfer flavoprotein subunit alpha n=1 Tax=Salmonella enterica subsp. enterica serovar Sanjuan TaxID=1160765 RepID=A0A3S4GZ84_SALET|nr:electron transfer flavoprotein subunit alpha [Salmonella enterica subsp. enterica serovar Sanjuan]